MRVRLLGCLLVMSALPLQAMAAISTADLEDFQLSLWKIRADFHMLTVMVGNTEYSSDLNASIRQAQSELSRLDQSAETDAERQLIAELQKNWRPYQQAAKGNTMAEQGFTNAYTTRDVNELPALMSEQIQAFDGASSGDYDDIRELSAFLQRMTSEYLNLAADPAGGMASGTDEGRLEFKDAVPKFEEMLKQAKQAHGKDEAMVRALAQVNVKWKFIRESMVKFYENAVPFLIYRYTNQMVDTLEQAISLASTDVDKPTFGPAQ